MSFTIEHEKGAFVPSIKTYGDKFLGHVVIVTGAGSGIGEATANLFAQQGAQLVLFDVNEDNLKRVQTSIQQGGGKADMHLCDISDEQSISKAVEATISSHGKIDILAHIAGIYPFHPLADFPTDVYRSTMTTNMDGTFFLTRAILPHMQKAGYGRIINTASSTVKDPGPGLAAYVTSKAAVVGFTRATAIEAGPGITVNVVLPGLISTPGTERLPIREALFQGVLTKQVVQRNGHVLDIAHLICFLASPEASFITGQSVACDGGYIFA